MTDLVKEYSLSLSCSICVGPNACYVGGILAL